METLENINLNFIFPICNVQTAKSHATAVTTLAKASGVTSA